RCRASWRRRGDCSAALPGRCRAAAYAAYTRGLCEVPPAVAGSVAPLEPVTAVWRAVAIVAERLGRVRIAGAALIAGTLVAPVRESLADTILPRARCRRLFVEATAPKRANVDDARRGLRSAWRRRG